jgi:transcriptional regulator with XRE-family HTH domain
MTDATQRVADHIRDLRAQRGWTQQQLAEACAQAAPGTYLSRGTIAKIESSSRKYVTAGELMVLAQVFDVSPSALLNDQVPYQVTRTWTVLATDGQAALDKARPGEHHDVVVRPMPCMDWPAPCTHDPQHVRPS